MDHRLVGRKRGEQSRGYRVRARVHADMQMSPGAALRSAVNMRLMTADPTDECINFTQLRTSISATFSMAGRKVCRHSEVLASHTWRPHTGPHHRHADRHSKKPRASRGLCSHVYTKSHEQDLRSFIVKEHSVGFKDQKVPHLDGPVG